MARWDPDLNSIGTNEHLGRRIIDELRLIGAQDQIAPDRLRAGHFMDTRVGEDVSLDRLGKSSIDKRVCNFLRPLAMRHAESFKEPREFRGWAVIRAGFLSKPPGGRGQPVSVVPDPILDEGEFSNK